MKFTVNSISSSKERPIIESGTVVELTSNGEDKRDIHFEPKEINFSKTGLVMEGPLFYGKDGGCLCYSRIELSYADQSSRAKTTIYVFSRLFQPSP